MLLCLHPCPCLPVFMPLLAMIITCMRHKEPHCPYRCTSDQSKPEAQIKQAHASTGACLPLYILRGTGSDDHAVPVGVSCLTVLPHKIKQYRPHLQDAHNLLRPETVESLFVLWRVTGDPLYRTWGWHIFRAFEKWTRLEGGGYANLHDVLHVRPCQSAFLVVGSAPWQRTRSRAWRG